MPWGPSAGRFSAQNVKVDLYWYLCVCSFVEKNQSERLEYSGVLCCAAAGASISTAVSGTEATGA